MTIRRWVVLLSWIAGCSLGSAHFKVRAGEISASAAKVFLTAAAAGEKSAPVVASAPSAAVPTPTAEAHSAAAVPPNLEAASEKAAAPNVLRPTAEQQAERVTPNAEGPLGESSRSSRRAPMPLPSPVAAPLTLAPTLAPPQTTPAPLTKPTLETLTGGSDLPTEKPVPPQTLQSAASQPAVTGKIELPAAVAGPQMAPLVGPSTAHEPAALPPAVIGPIAGESKPLEFDPATGKTYHNVLRENERGISPLRPMPTETKTPTIASPTPATSGPQVIELTPSFAAETKSPAVASKPQIGTPTLAKEAAKPLAPPTATTTITDTPPSVAAMSTPTPAASTPAVSKPAVSTPTAVAAPATTQPRPNSLLSPGDEPPSQRAVVAKTPAQSDSKKLFEATEEPPALTAEQEILRRRVQNTLATYFQNWTLNTREHSPWEVMHAIIAYGVDTRLNHNGKPITAIGHLCFSGVSNRQQLVTVARNGRLHMNLGPGVQGHAGQFLAIVAQSQLQRDYPLYVGGKEFTLEDLIKAEQYACESGTELTFKLIGLMHYLPSDAEWTNFQGQKWSLDRLVREEIVQPVRGAACGGTHRLMGLSYAVRKREQRGEPIVGIFKEAEKYIDQYHKYTFGLQNPDGSFSTAWFVRREARLDLDRRLQTTGHILEWLCFSLDDEQLRDPRVTKSVKYVTDLLLDEQHEWEIGHLGHALHALQIYNERVYGGPVRSLEGMVSRRPIKTAKQATPNVNNQ